MQQHANRPPSVSPVHSSRQAALYPLCQPEVGYWRTDTGPGFSLSRRLSLSLQSLDALEKQTEITERNRDFFGARLAVTLRDHDGAS